ncbi:phasin family protein [Enterobacter roggenkampii]|uniref:phasin family protein n=1 Tax=Enterobacter roggenkampii TaxID=1812935 RepID=UPI0022382894|nr:phasin family protein [Enterobacter roggenkampii]MCW5003532.1 phasin family protein [Enterobacter roggenkampii]
MRTKRAGGSSLFQFDMDELQGIARQAGATKKQMEMAYSRALSRTAVTLKKEAMKLVREGLSLKSHDQLRKRLLSLRNSTKGTAVDEFKLWFGLNRIKVKDLRGRIRGETLPRHSVRGPDGRFVTAPVRQPASFIPKGRMLREQSWPEGRVVLDRKGQKTIRVDRRDVEIDVYDALNTQIEDDIFPRAVEIFLNHFRTDLRGRVAAGIHSRRKNGT